MLPRNPTGAPLIDPKLIDWLDKLFPERCPDVGDSERKIWIDVGSRKVVRRLQQERKRQEENIRNV